MARYHWLGTHARLAAAAALVLPLSACDECIDGATRICACPSGNGMLLCNDGEWRDCDCFGGGVPPPGFCGDGFCAFPEDSATCPSDCFVGSVCGDGICDFDEDATFCPFDCPCGDGICTAADRTSCPGDCTRECLRRECGPLDDARTCPGVCMEEICGDGICWPPEVESVTCRFDCMSDAGVDGGTDGGTCADDGGCDAGAPMCTDDGGCADAAADAG